MCVKEKIECVVDRTYEDGGKMVVGNGACMLSEKGCMEIDVYDYGCVWETKIERF